MTSEEVKTYNYIYHKFGEGKANEYLKLLTNQMRYAISVEGNIMQAPDGLNYRWGVIDASDDNFLEKMGNSIGVGLKRFGINIAQLFSSEPIPPTKNEYRYEITLSESRKAEKILYSILEGIGEELPSTLLTSAIGVFGKGAKVMTETAISVMSGAGEAYRTSLNEGFNKVQACNYATLIGASELCLGFIAEKVDDIITSNASDASEKIVKVASEKIAAADTVFKNVSQELQSLMISGTEEAIKNLLRPIFEEWIFDETMSKVDFETMVTDYLITALTKLAS